MPARQTGRYHAASNGSPQAILTTFRLSDKTYRLNQLRYDLRKLKGHGLLQRDGSRYSYRLTPKGIQIALLFLTGVVTGVVPEY